MSDQSSEQTLREEIATLRRRNAELEQLLAANVTALSSQQKPMNGAISESDQIQTSTQPASSLPEPSEHDRTEARLRLFEVLVENALDGIGVAALDGTITYGNRAFKTLTGFGDRAIGSAMAEYFAPEDFAQVVQEVLPSITECGSYQGRLRYRRPDNSYFLGQISAFVLKDTTSAPTGQAVIVRDISEQQRAEDQLRTFYALAENAPDGFALANLQGNLTYLNPALSTILGYEHPPVDKPVTTLFSADDERRIAAIVQHVIDHEAWQGKIMCQRADGSTFDAQLSAFAVRDNDGQPFMFAGIIRDISEQLRADQERLALQEQVIAAQEAALRELSTPLLPISEEVVVMPIVGSVNNTRAQQIMETLLEGIAAQQATTAILDITGVKVVDTQIANALIQVAQAAQLLGAQVVLTGIGPEIAQTFVHLGADLRGMVTQSTLQSGIAYALDQAAH